MRLWKRGTPAPPDPLLLPTFQFWSPIDAQSVGQFSQWLANGAQRKSKKRQHVVVSLNTPGGCIYSSMAMYDAIRLYNQYMDISIMVTGRCQSGGMTVLMSVPVGRRYCTAGADLMIHPASYTETGSGSESATRLYSTFHEPGRPPILKHREVHVYSIQERCVVRCLSMGSGLSIEQVRQLMAGEDRHMTPAEAMELGFIGHIL